jgi:Tfp pilus assembly protein FimV
MVDVNAAQALQTILLSAALVAGSVVALKHATHVSMDEIEWEKKIHHVQPGDTLWYIASNNIPRSIDKRDWIAAVMELNHMTEHMLRPYDFITILVPAEKEATDG